MTQSQLPSGLGKAGLPGRRFSGQYTIDEALEIQGTSPYMMKLVAFGAIVWSMDAVEIMLIAFLVPIASCTMSLSPSEEAWLGASPYLGMLKGGLLFGAVSDKLGRLRGIQYMAGTCLVATLATALAPSYQWLLVGRFLMGLGLGGCSSALVFVAEQVPATARTWSMLVVELSWCVGAAAMVFTCWMISNSMTWRWLVAASMLPQAAIFVYSFFIYESPRWLLMNGHTAKARDILEHIAEENGTPLKGTSLTTDMHVRTPSPPGTTTTWHDYITTFATQTVVLLRRLSSREHLHTSVTLAIMWFCNGLAYYGVMLLLVKVSETTTTKCVDDKTGRPVLLYEPGHFINFVLSTLVEVPGLLLTFTLMSIIGRLTTMRCVTCLAFLAMLLTLIKVGPLSLLLPRLFAASAFACLDTYTPEVFSTDVRSFAFGTAQAMSRIGASASPFVAFVIADGALQGACGIILMVMALMMAASWSLTQETNNERLKERSAPMSGQDDADLYMSDLNASFGQHIPAVRSASASPTAGGKSDQKPSSKAKSSTFAKSAMPKLPMLPMEALRSKP